MIKILFSNKDDWKTKSENRYNPSVYDFHYADFNKIKRLHDYDMIIPLYEKDIHILNYRFTKWSHKFITPSNAVVDFCNDKLKFNLDMIAQGYSAYIPEILTVPKKYPYILKKNFDEWGLNAHIIDHLEKEQSLAHLLDDPEYFKQEYITGPEEYATHFIYTQHKLKYCQTFKFTFPKSMFIKGAESPPFKTAVIIPVETDFKDLFEEMLKKIDFNGVGCFNFKVVNGIPKIFEVNPRAGGSLPLDLIPFLEAYHSCVLEQKPTEEQVNSYWTRIKSWFRL